ncbi:hypothetical protein D5086_021847 [Populus alba]|uniref:Uncharacterized protein n=1 Tax=Populus alba TaxID=43335 RepID=A0ACC4BEV6_POPAL
MEIQELKNQINDKKSHNIHGKIDRYDQSSPLEAEPGTSHAEDEGRLWHKAIHQRHAGHNGEIPSLRNALELLTLFTALRVEARHYYI